MTFNGWLQITLYAVLIVLIAKPFGGYMTHVLNGERIFCALSCVRSRSASTRSAASVRTMSSTG
jgi:K+-transporting ATPase A subunit